MELTLPELTGKRIAVICHQLRVLAGRGEAEATESEENEVLNFEIVVPRLHGREGEAIDRQRDWA